MQIWMDGDACPGEVKDLLFRTAQRRKIHLTVVANLSIRIPRSPHIDSMVVGAGANLADLRIVELLAPGDLVVTADIPLAAAVVKKGGLALNPRGELYTEHNVGDRLATRNMMDDLRGGGQITGGPSNYSQKDKQAFANQLDRWVTRMLRCDATGDA
ncbi:MAG: YaiI/YqxD family protein [Planctomycetaceae bacterium]|nr:YaiI/YqxD family protein [Planctomycetaceae bacterium]MCA9065141.1 YaiI/YqxD family protein [Planctomycetaceae bacterium]